MTTTRTAVEEFWGETVLAGPFESVAESNVSLMQREHLFPGLYELMPVDFPDCTVLDFGCGPGHDTVLFAESGADVWYADVSLKALTITGKRLEMHELHGTAIHVHDEPGIHLARRFDHIHCAGVLHHTNHPDAILRAFREVLQPGCECRVMIYDGDLSPHTQSDVPVTHWWGEQEFAQMALTAGFSLAEKVGIYPCSAPWRPDCLAACYRLT